MMITRKQAETVLAAIKRRYSVETEESQPKIIENWDWLSSPTRWAIIWEEGPFEWALRVSGGGWDEERYWAVRDALGKEAADRKSKAGDFTDPPLVVPDGTYLEPVNGWSLGIYEV